MADTAQKHSPLAGVSAPERAITLSEKPFVGKLNIRGNADDAAFADAAKKVLGTALPTTPNTVVQAKGITVFWLGPDEWLVHTAEDAQSALHDKLRTAFAELHCAITDVSDYFVVIEMRATTPGAARDVLARGCSLDLHPRVFGPGQCAQSHFAHANILLHQVSDDAYDIQVRMTYAVYLWNYFADCAKQLAV